MTKEKQLSLLNLFSVIAMIAVNYASVASKINNTTIAAVSAEYDTLFTPAGYAFSIWGIIFLNLIAYAVYQVKMAFFSEEDCPSILQTGYWFALANVCNILWIFAFCYGQLGLSVVLMFLLLYSLIKIILNTNMERWDAPIDIIAFVWWPICWYSGWIAVATITNVAAYLTKLGWDGGFISEVGWTITMIMVATLLNIMMILTRNMREFALVGAWGIFAIYMRQKADHSTIAITALVCSIILVIAVIMHVYNNWAYNPFKKLMQKLNKE